MADTDRKIACDFTAIPENERDDHAETAEAVFESIERYRELPDGYAFELPPETDVISKTGSFIARERLCCPFFTFDLVVEADEGSVWLKLTGDPAVKQYIQDTVLEEWDF